MAWVRLFIEQEAIVWVPGQWTGSDLSDTEWRDRALMALDDSLGSEWETIIDEVWVADDRMPYQYELPQGHWKRPRPRRGWADPVYRSTTRTET